MTKQDKQHKRCFAEALTQDVNLNIRSVLDELSGLSAAERTCNVHRLAVACLDYLGYELAHQQFIEQSQAAFGLSHLVRNELSFDAKKSGNTSSQAAV